jgi:hypothetical protein
MSNLTKRIKDKTKKILRDEFGFFYPLAGQTVLAVQHALAKRVPGAYYEFGLYQGFTFYEAVKASPDIHHFGFDSFEGMPDNTEGGGFGLGRFKVTYKKVLLNLLDAGAFSHREHLIKGFFSDSLTPQLQSELRVFPVSVVLIDSDLYESAVTVLEFIKPLLQTGSIVIFDDWGSFGAEAGEQRAWREFLATHTDVVAVEITDSPNRKMFRVTLTA